MILKQLDIQRTDKWDKFELQEEKNLLLYPTYLLKYYQKVYEHVEYIISISFEKQRAESPARQ